MTTVLETSIFSKDKFRWHRQEKNDPTAKEEFQKITTEKQLAAYFFPKAEMGKPFIRGREWIYDPYLVNFTLSKVGNASDLAEDILQQAYIDCLKFIKSGQVIQVKTFITKVILARAADYFRKSESRELNFILLLPLFQMDQILSNDVNRVFWEAFSSIPSLYANLLTLRYIFEMDVQSIVDTVNEIYSLRPGELVTDIFDERVIKNNELRLFLTQESSKKPELGNITFIEVLKTLKIEVQHRVTYSSIESSLSRARKSFENELDKKGFKIPEGNRKPRKRSSGKVGKILKQRENYWTINYELSTDTE